MAAWLSSVLLAYITQLPSCYVHSFWIEGWLALLLALVHIILKLAGSATSQHLFYDGNIISVAAKRESHRGLHGSAHPLVLRPR